MEEDCSSDGAGYRIDKLGVGAMREVPHGSAGCDDKLAHRNEELHIPEEAKHEVKQAVLHAFIPIHGSEWRVLVDYDLSG